MSGNSLVLAFIKVMHSHARLAGSHLKRRRRVRSLQDSIPGVNNCWVSRRGGQPESRACALPWQCMNSVASVEGGRKMAAAVLEHMGRDFLVV